MMKKSFLLCFLWLLFGAAHAQQLRAQPADASLEAPDMNNGIQQQEVNETHQRRELFSFWSLLFALHPPGPPHPPGHHSSSHSGGGNYQTGAEAGYSGGGSSSSYSSSSSFGGGSAATRNGSNVGSDSVAGISSGAAKNAFIMLIVAVVAAAVAAMAIVFGQRKTNPEAHPLTGKSTTTSVHPAYRPFYILKTLDTHKLLLWHLYRIGCPTTSSLWRVCRFGSLCRQQQCGRNDGLQGGFGLSKQGEKWFVFGISLLFQLCCDSCTRRA